MPTASPRSASDRLRTRRCGCGPRACRPAAPLPAHPLRAAAPPPAHPLRAALITSVRSSAASACPGMSAARQRSVQACDRGTPARPPPALCRRRCASPGACSLCGSCRLGTASRRAACRSGRQRRRRRSKRASSLPEGLPAALLAMGPAGISRPARPAPAPFPRPPFSRARTRVHSRKDWRCTGAALPRPLPRAGPQPNLTNERAQPPSESATASSGACTEPVGPFCHRFREEKHLPRAPHAPAYLPMFFHPPQPQMAP